MHRENWTAFARSRRSVRTLALAVVGVATLGLSSDSLGLTSDAHAAASLSVTPLTWNVVGLRSNVGGSKTGPGRFPVGSRICNSSAAGTTAATDVRTRFTFEGTDASTRAGFSLDGGISVDTLGDLAPGACADSYYNVLLEQRKTNIGNFRQYFVEAYENALPSGSSKAQYPPASGTGSSRGLYIEALVKQSRNVTRKISGPGGCNYDYTDCDAIPTNLTVGDTYTYKLYASTSTAYEQLESFITFPRSTFRVISASSTYQTPAGRTISRPWSNACGWNPDYDASTDATCGFSPPSEFQPTGKAGRNVVTTYKVKVVGAGTGNLTTLIYDYSGSSFHYNADFGTNAGTFTASYPLTTTVTGNGLVSSSPSGINCGTTGANCKASYSSGTSVTLTATPGAGQTFTGWGGACSGSSSTCAVTMSEARNVTATFTGVSSFPLSVVVQGSGTVTSDSGGVSCTSSGGAGCQKPYSSGTSVTLTAAPAVGWDFSGWSGACSNTSGTCTVTMDQARDVTALFEPAAVVTRSLTVTDLPVDADLETLPPVGGAITSAASGGGGVNLNCGAFCLGEYLNDATVTVTATPAADYKLVSWGAACSTATISATPTAAQTCTVPMTQNQNVSANFVLTSSTTNYNLTAATTLSGSSSTVAGQVTSNIGAIDCGATTTDCIKSFLSGTQVTLTATPAADKKFNGWKDSSGARFTGCQNEADPDTSTTCGVLVDAAKTVKADFLTVPNYYLQVNVGGNGSGGVRTSSGTDINCATGLAGTSADCSESYGSSTAVTLTATPDTGSTFDGFTASNCPAGTVGGSGTTCTVTVSQARTVDANFTLIELRKLSVQKGGTGGGALTATVGGSSDGDIACDAACLAVREKNYNKGTIVSLVATPSSGSRFRGWKELDGTTTTACSENASTSTTCTVALSVSRSLVANLGAIKTLSGSKAGSGDGTLTTSNTNWDAQKTDCPIGTAACAADYDQGDSVTLTASPEAGSRFAGWSGACSASSGDCTVTMDAATSVTAQFVAVKQLSVSKNGNGKGAVAGSVNSFADTDLACIITCSAQKQKTFDKDTVVTLTATPGASGSDLSRFAGWKKTDGTSFDGCGLGEAADTSATCTVTLSQARSVVAKFIAIRGLSVDKAGNGKGAVAGSVGSSADTDLACIISCASQKQKDYDLDTVVTLTAAPGESGSDLSRFDGWKTSAGSAYTECSEGLSGANSTCTVTLSEARSIVAKFVAVRTLTVDKYGGPDGDGKGSVSAAVSGSSDPDLACGASCSDQKQKGYDLDTAVKLTAAPGTADADLSEFQGWKSAAGGDSYTGCSEGGSGTGADCTVTLSEARTLVAQFKAIRRLNVSKIGSGAGGISGKVGGSADADADLTCDVACVASREKTFDRGTGVEVKALPDAGSTFAGWKNADGSTFTGCSEGDSGLSATCTVTLSEARVLRARFNSAVIVTKRLEVDKVGNGGGEVVGRVDGSTDTDLTCESDCSDKKIKDLDESSTVVLTASPVASGDNRSRFAGWKQADGTTAASECQESDPSTSAECTLSMGASRSVIARFILIKKLTVDKMVNGALSGAAGLVSSDIGAISCNYTGTPCTSADQDFDFPGTGTAVTLSAESADDDRYRFDRWAGCGSNPTASQCTVTMDQARDVTAQFVEVRRLSVAKTLNGSGSGSDAGRGGSVVSDGSSPAIDCTAGANCQSAFSRFDFSGGDGTGVTLAASVPEPDSYRFDGWAGACSGSASTCSVSMDQVRSVTAKFVKVRKLTVTKKVNGATDGGGGGGHCRHRRQRPTRQDRLRLLWHAVRQLERPF